MKLKNKFIAKKSLFKKYMNVSLIMVFFSFLVLGIILIITITNYWSNQKRIDLDSRAENIAEFIRSNVAINQSLDGREDSFSINRAGEITDFLKLYVNDAGVDVIVTNTNARSILVVSNEKNVISNMIVAPDAVQKSIMESSYFSKGTLGGIYDYDRYIAARPIYYNNGKKVMGVVFVTSDMSDIAGFTDMMLKVFVLSAFAALAISILGIGLFSYNLVKPLRQMSQAAKQFGKGDFSIRVSETSNDEIGELAVAFNNMAESLSSSEQIRKSFVANVSHELKTPMTTISGFIDGILDGTIPPEKQDYYLHIVSDEVKRLSRLVRSMLDLSRIDSGELKLNYQNFDLFSTLVTVVITFEQEIDKKNIEIRGLDKITPKNVYGDKDLLHQVVYNLIENAVKFTNEGGYIEFDITENSERTDFSITNSGHGIEKAEIGLIFDRFYKTDKSRSKDKKGLGLGLYLVRSIIRLHGGDITAESVVGEYCQFKFYIPKKQNGQKKQERKNLP
ncbi:MAG: HAMP domain-containing sensor histidine kinase [Clostridia bacterium]|nr:HAMP domain-containing sensor histidine kinase [Clostridia bacterium]